MTFPAAADKTPSNPVKAEVSSQHHYRAFPVDVLPEPCRTFVVEAAAAIGCDSSYVALPLLACLARAIGNTRVIRLKRSWSEPAIIWAAIVGKSGTHKSPALQAATNMLARKQSEAIAEHVEALARHAQAIQEYERDFAAWKRAKTNEPPPWEPPEPQCRRFICSDVTIEALAMLLDGQDDGVLVVRDELAGWVDGIGEYKKAGKGSDTGHWLACWSGAPMTVDRKTGAKLFIHIPRAAVSIIGGIQPGILRRAIGREHMQDGLCARLLLAMPEPRRVVWSEVTVRQSTETAMADVLGKLLELEAAADAEGNPIPFAMPLTAEAKAAWVAYYDRHRREMESLDDDLASAYAKLEAYSARFALLFQLCSWAAGEASSEEVDQRAVEAGVALSDWFAAEAQRVYGLFHESDEERELRELAEWIARRGGATSERDLARNGPPRFRQDAEEWCADLVRIGRARWEYVPPGPQGGRPTRLLKLCDETPINPEESDGFVAGVEVDDAVHETQVCDETHAKPERNGGFVADSDEINARLAEAAEDAA